MHSRQSTWKMCFKEKCKTGKKWVSTLIHSVEALTSYVYICNSVRILFTDGELFISLKFRKSMSHTSVCFFTVQLLIPLYSWLLGFFPRMKIRRECSLPSHGDKLISKSCLLPYNHIQYCTLQAVPHRPTYSIVPTCMRAARVHLYFLTHSVANQTSPHVRCRQSDVSFSLTGTIAFFIK